MILQAEEVAYATILLGWIIFWIVFAVIWCVIGTIVSLWIYKDAKELKYVDETVWAILGFFLSIIGLIIYIILKKISKKL